MVATLSLNGCLFDTLGSQLRRLRSQVDVLDARVVQLELIHQTQVGTSLGPVSSGESALSLTTAPPLEEAISSTVSSIPDIPTTGSAANAPGSFQFPFLQLPWRKVFAKLARGFINTVTGWVEIPKRADETSNASGVGAGLTFGLLRGVGRGFVRTVGGIYEVATFLFPAPPDYEPIIRPRYVFTCEETDSRPGGYSGAQ